MSFPNIPGSEKYVIPALTGIVEIYTGVEADLIGTYWHICKGQDVTLTDGSSITLPDLNDVYIRFTDGSTRAVGAAEQSIGEPSNAGGVTRLEDGHHQHNTATNWAQRSTESGRHAHSFTINVPLKQTSTTSNGDWRSGNGSARDVVHQNGSNSGNVQNTMSITSTDLNFSSITHSHSLTITPNSAPNPTNGHHHVLTSAAPELVLDGTQYYHVMFIEGVKYNG